MCLHVNSLPDDCLLPIFDRVSLLELLRLDCVCPRWACLLSSACARRRTLALILGGSRVNDVSSHIAFNNTFYIGFNGGNFDLSVPEREASLTLPFLLSHIALDDESEFNDILYSTSMAYASEEQFTEMARFRTAHISGQLVPYLNNLLPNVDTLVVTHSDCFEDELNSVIDLLAFWSLRFVKLCLRNWRFDDEYEDSPDSHPVRTLLRCIAQQSSLQQLTLVIDGDRFRVITILSESFSFIAQLKVVKLFFGCDKFIWDIVHKFDHPELRHIGLGNDFLRMEDVLNPKFRFATKVRQLYGDLRIETVAQLEEFCWRFPSLTSLQIIWSPHITFTRLVANLAVLKQLTHLKLNITFRQHPENAFALVDRVDGVEKEPRRISLPQVKTLELYIHKRSHHHFESLSPLVFPSVKVIILVNLPSACTTCKPSINGPYGKELANQCHRLLVLSLQNTFGNSTVRLYAKHYGETFVDWTNYARTDDDDQPEEV